MQLRCPICNKLGSWNLNPNRPFCSERCKLVDLGRWATEAYRLETTQDLPTANDGEDNGATDHHGKKG